MEPSLQLPQPNQRLLASLENWAQALKTQGVEKEITSRDSLLKIQELDEAQVEAIIEFSQANADIINSFHSKERVLEKSLLLKALNYFGLVADDRIWNVMDDDSVVEIYGPNMKQLYRSVNFYQYSSYSLLDLAAFEWFYLWDRPKAVTEMMMVQAKQVLAEFTPVMPMTAPVHYMREIRDTGLSGKFVPRAILFSPGHVGSVKMPLSSAPVGLMCMSKGDVIAVGNDTFKVGIV